MHSTWERTVVKDAGSCHSKLVKCQQSPQGNSLRFCQTIEGFFVVSSDWLTVKITIKFVFKYSLTYYTKHHGGLKLVWAYVKPVEHPYGTLVSKPYFSLIQISHTSARDTFPNKRGQEQDYEQHSK